LVLEPPTDGLLLVSVTNLSGLVVPLVTSPNWSAGTTARAVSVPVPLSAVVAGLLLTFAVTLTPPVCVPCVVGEKVTPTVQLDPAIPLAARTVDPLRLHGFEPVLVRAN
jgi:hypothetical protein